MWDLSVSFKCSLYRTLPTGELAAGSKTNAPAACFFATFGPPCTKLTQQYENSAQSQVPGRGFILANGPASDYYIGKETVLERRLE
jgi:hypothetical protein